MSHQTRLYNYDDNLIDLGHSIGVSYSYVDMVIFRQCALL